MKKILSTILLLSTCFISVAEEIPKEAIALADGLKPLGNDPIIIAAVQAQNAKGVSLNEIKALDAKWRKVSGVDDFMKSLMNSAVAKKLIIFESSKPFYIELFIMDNQGANVAMTSKTSDYWQGDEAKWQKSYADGKGAVHFGQVKFDESAQAYLVQISIPVMDGGKAIGAITIGVNLDELGV